MLKERNIEEWLDFNLNFHKKKKSHAYSYDDTIIISIDLPGGAFGGGYPQWRIPLYKTFASQTQKIYLNWR